MPVVKRGVYQMRSIFILLPVFVLDDSVHYLPHLLGEGGGVGGELLSRGPSPLPLSFPVIIFVPSSSPPQGRGGTREVQVTVPFSLTSCLFVTHLLLHLLQCALLYRLQRHKR